MPCIHNNSYTLLHTIKLVLLVLLLYSPAASAVDPALNWKTIETDNFYIHYAEGFTDVASKAANIAENAHNRLKPELNWQPEDKTHLVISDETDFANGFATPIHFNRSVLFVSPPDAAQSLEDFADWLDTLIVHEYVHILHLDKTSGLADGLRSVFGRQFLLFPNAYQPNWFTEGIATHYETDEKLGIGRGQSSLFRMMMRTEVESGIKPVSQVNLPNRSWPMGTIAYLYGVHFYQFLDEKYGVDVRKHLIENYSDNIIPFMINTNSKAVLDVDIKALWNEFSVWLNAKYKQDIGIHATAGVVEGQRLTEFGYLTSSPVINEYGEVIYVTNGVYEHAALRSYKDGEHKKIADVHNGARVNINAKGKIIITQAEFCDEYNLNFDIYLITRDKLERKTECGRYRSATISPDGNRVAAVKIEKGISELVLLDTEGKMIKSLWQGNDTDIISQIQWSPKLQRILASVFRQGQGWNIEEFNLDTLEWVSITNDQFIDMYPSYSDAGDSILFSSDRTGRYQIYRKEISGNVLQQLTRVPSGAFYPVQYSEQSPLYYIGYNNNGYDLYELENIKALTTLEIKSEDIQQVIVAKEIEKSKQNDYSALSSLAPRWWFPNVFLSEDRKEYGFVTSAADALDIHNYSIDLSYDTENDWFVGSMIYGYANNFSLGYQRSTDIFKDEEGEFALARNIDDVFMAYALNYPGIESSYNVIAAVKTSKSSDGRRANNIPANDDFRDNLASIAVLFDNSNRYIRSISPSDGRNIRLMTETSEIADSDFTGEIYTLDWREYIGLGAQHVLAIRLIQGWGTEQPKRFRLGGEDTELEFFDFISPVREPLIGRRDYPLRGYDEGLSELIGRRMQLASMEWRIPGTLVERGLMAPPIGLIQWSSSLFVESGAAYNGSKPDVYYSSAGFELHGDVNLFYGLTSRMRIGFASGLDDDIGENRVYFSLGASF